MSHAGAGGSITDPETERDPPPSPTPVTFPCHAATATRPWDEETPPPQIQELLSRICRPTQISDAHLDALNIRIESCCLPEDLLPTAPDGSSYFPSLIPPSPSEARPPLPVVGEDDNTPARKSRDFHNRLLELQVDNDVAFRVLTRTTKPGSRPPRIVFLRKFWEALENASQYWDVSLDEYWMDEFADDDDDEKNEPDNAHKRQRLTPSETADADISIPYRRTRSEDMSFPAYFEPEETKQDSPIEQLKLNQDTTDDEDAPEADPFEHAASQHDATTTSGLCLRYRGRRIGSGRDMPDIYRDEMVRGLVEAAVWPFSCAVISPRGAPIVQVNNLLLPIRQTSAVFRLPRDRSKQRAGVRLGPVLIVQARPETDFEEPDLSGGPRDAKARLDLLREISALLQLAQERDRQGKTATRPGEGKWWTTVPRWGGNKDDVSSDDEAKTKDVLDLAQQVINVANGPLRKTPTMLWKELKCGSGLWESNVEYMSVGKEPDSEYDEVFLLSSLNHHVSVVKLTVHAAYLEYLLTETMPDPLPEASDWSTPRMQRTQWFDLLEVNGRVEAFRTLWGVTAYLMRATGSSAG